MKKALILTLAIGTACAMSSMAQTTYDLYITGSTAFRKNVHDACKALYDTTPTTGAGTLQYGAASSGGTGAANNGNTQWTMTGTCNSTVPNLGSGNVLTIHALFTGSVQGSKSVFQNPQQKLVFLTSSGGLMTNTATIAFSDCASSSTIYDVAASANPLAEENVAVQPFVWCKAINGSPLLTNVNNISWEQAKYIITAGRAHLSAWTYKAADTNLVYILQRTQDSGTRRIELANDGFGYNQGLSIYNYDVTNSVFYQPYQGGNQTNQSTSGGGNIGVIGVAGNGNANMFWGPGYVAGSDLSAALNVANAANTSIAFLSMNDSKGVGSSNWAGVVSFDGVWPTAAGSGIWGNTGTNDYAPITRGQYPGYGDEVLDYPTADPSSVSSDQNLTANILGYGGNTVGGNLAGSILGILNKKHASGAAALVSSEKGSLEQIIEQSKTGGAVAIPYYDMHTTRGAVGGVITP